MFSTSLLAHERTLADRRGGGGRPFSLLGETPAKTRGLVASAGSTLHETFGHEVQGRLKTGALGQAAISRGQRFCLLLAHLAPPRGTRLQDT
jgi:hypothetical protein